MVEDKKEERHDPVFRVAEILTVSLPCDSQSGGLLILLQTSFTAFQKTLTASLMICLPFEGYISSEVVVLPEEFTAALESSCLKLCKIC